MTQKPFEDLTISDDFMFCKVMEYESICKEFLEMLFTIKIEKITYLSSQNTVTTNSGAKTIRLDVLVKDDAGTSYNVEMCFPIDVRVYRKTRVLPFGKTSLLRRTTAIRGGTETPFANRWSRCKEIAENKAEAYRVYGEHLFSAYDTADARIFVKDAKKIILNANAFNTTDNKDLHGFLQYVKTGKITTDYTGRIEQMIQAVKRNEQLRKEYHILPAALMDAFDEGEAHGKSLGLAEGSRQKALETARILKQFGDSVQKIMQVTGLSKADVEGA